MTPGHNVFYNNGNGHDRDDDRVGQVLGEGSQDGRLKVQQANGDPGDFQFLASPEDHEDRGDCCWAVH